MHTNITQNLYVCKFIFSRAPNALPCSIQGTASAQRRVINMTSMVNMTNVTWCALGIMVNCVVDPGRTKSTKAATS